MTLITILYQHGGREYSSKINVEAGEHTYSAKAETRLLRLPDDAILRNVRHQGAQKNNPFVEQWGNRRVTNREEKPDGTIKFQLEKA